MRLSPALLALLTTSATLGLATTARADVSADSVTSEHPLAQVRQAGAAELDLTGLVAEPFPTTGADQLAQLGEPDRDPLFDTTPDPNQDDGAEREFELDLGDDEAEPTEAPQLVPDAPEAGDPLSPQAEDEEEVRVLVAERRVITPDGQLLEDFLDPGTVQQVFGAIATQPGRTTTRSQLQQDINNIFATGYFANVEVVPEDTPLGVRITYFVEPNPVLTAVTVQDNQVLPQAVIDDIFGDQVGEILNLVDFQDGILEVNQWYEDNGYVLAQVSAAPQISDEGVVTLVVAEGEIEDITVRFIDADGNTTDENGEPIRGRTRDFIVTREFDTQPGDIFRRDRIERDLQRAFGLGIFDDIRLSLEPGTQDPRKVNVVVNVAERNTGSVAAGLGFNFSGDLFGSASYREDNFGGNNQQIAAEIQANFQDILFDVSFTDPWIGGDPLRTSYTANAFARRSISLVFDGGPTPVTLPNGDRPRVRRLGGGLSFSRPLSDRVTASLGGQYQRVSVRDIGGTINPVDELGGPLTLSDSGVDDLFTVQFGLVRDLRDSRTAPTSGNVLQLTTEQSVPLGSGSIFMNRVRGSYSQFVPVDFLNFSEGPQTLAFNIQAGTIVGDLPPYEAFAIGGTNSVRGYEEGAVGSGRNFLQATAEYRFPLFSFVGGALFLDIGSDLGSGGNIPGRPGQVRGKPGGGYGYGAGVRVQTPLGPLRLDYGINDQGENRFHFGIGERF